MIDSRELDLVKDVLDSGVLVHGPQIEEFEQRFRSFTGSQFAVGVSSCTAGLHMIWLALGLGPGDEVIVSSQTHVASAHSIELVGAKPVFVDSDSSTGNLDIGEIENLISSRTRAILVVHYLGTPVDMERVTEIGERYNLKIVEDCALALGAKFGGQHVGTFGTAASFSFYPAKHITSAEGGMVTTQFPEVERKIRSLRAFGYQAKDEMDRGRGMYDVVDLGMNYRMSEIHAAIGNAQLDKLPNFLETRKRNYESYVANVSEHLSDFGFTFLEQPSDSDFISSHYAFVLLFDKVHGLRQTELRSSLTAKGIGSSVYYPHPVPNLTYYAEKYGQNKSFPNASRISYTGIALPLGPHVTKKDVGEIIFSIKEIASTLGELE